MLRLNIYIYVYIIAETLVKNYLKEIFLETLDYDSEAKRIIQVLLSSDTIAQSIQQSIQELPNNIKKTNTGQMK